MAGPIKLYFDVWDAGSPTGTALGELTKAYAKKLHVVLSDVGGGEFVINKNDAQSAWCGTGNLVRVRLVAGGPFAWNDARYKAAFYIEDGDDDTVSEDEDAGEEWSRGGRGILSVLEKLVWWKSTFIGGAAGPRDDGKWHWSNDQFGDIHKRMILEWNARTAPKPKPATITYDFTSLDDSDGVTWPNFSGDFTIDVGTDYLAGAGLLISQGLEIDMTPAFLARAWNTNGKGSNRAGDRAFRKGWNVREGGNRKIYAPRRATRALVKGDGTASAAYVEVTDGYTLIDESGKWGRREAFVAYERTTGTAPLTRAGQQALSKLRKLDEGPVTIGVTSYGGGSDGLVPAAVKDWIPFTDYDVGDTCTVDIPGEYNNAAKRLVEISMNDGEAGEAEVTLTFGGTPFDPSRSAAQAYGNPLGGSGGCNCPTPCEDVADVVWETGITWKVAKTGTPPAGWHLPGFADGGYSHAVHDTVGGWYDATSPRWIWEDVATGSPAKQPDAEERSFRKAYTLEDIPKKVTGIASADNGCEVYVNGTLVHTVGGSERGGLDVSPFNYATGSAFDVDPALLVVGENVVSVIGWNENRTPNDSGPAGVYVVITLDWLTGDEFQYARCSHGHSHAELGGTLLAGSHPATAVSEVTDGDVQRALDKIRARAWKLPVRAASTANGTLASAFENGDTLDGVTLATGDRILLKDQTAGAENGIYTVNASGAPTRTSDFDTGTEALGAAVLVLEGSANGDKLYICTTNGPITLGTTALAFAGLSSASSFVEGASSKDSGTGDVTTTSSLQDLTGATHSLSIGTWLVIGVGDVRVNNSGNDRLFELHLDVGGVDENDFGPLLGLGLDDTDRQPVVQIWRVVIASTTTVKLRAKHTGGATGDFTVLGANTTLTAFRVGGDGKKFFSVSFFNDAPVSGAGLTTKAVNSTSYVRTAPAGALVDFGIVPWTHFAILIHGRSNAAGQTVTFEVEDDFAGFVPLHTGGNDLNIPNTTAWYDSGWRTIDTMPAAGLRNILIAVKGSNSTVDYEVAALHLAFKYDP